MTCDQCTPSADTSGEGGGEGFVSTADSNQKSNVRVSCFLFFLVVAATVVAVFTASVGPLAKVPGASAVVSVDEGEAVNVALNAACGCTAVSADAGAGAADGAPSGEPCPGNVRSIRK